MGARYEDDVHAPLRPGAHFDGRATTFTVWTTCARRVDVLVGEPSRTAPTVAEVEAFRVERLEPVGDGWFSGRIADVGPGHLYFFALDGVVRPDPFARFVPFGVHGPARVERDDLVAPLAAPPAPHAWILYELHVGTFSPEGTFRGVERRLDHLVDLGVTAIELMPVAAFAGQHGWGYDGTHWLSPHAPYGEPDDLRALVRAAHERGLAVVLDVVYNHFGPSGNYLASYAPEYFLAEGATRWGAAPNFSLATMRELVIESARHWLVSYGFDGLRVDATHAVRDPSILVELTAAAHALDPPRRVFFEDGRNDPDVFARLGADGVWADDFHDLVHVLSTGERDGYYAAHEPCVTALADAIRHGWSYDGRPYAPWGGALRGKPFDPTVPPHGLVYGVQNHDQIGNRPFGTRRHHEGELEDFVADVMLLLFLPSTPLLFMGQEWATKAPFLYFCDHDDELGRRISAGRCDEFRSFEGFADPDVRARIPDPQARATFDASKLAWSELEEEPHREVLEVHRAMIALRLHDPVLSVPCAWSDLVVHADETTLDVVRRTDAGERRFVRRFGRPRRPMAVPPGWRAIVERKSAIVLARG